MHSASASQHPTLKLRPRSSQLAEELEELDADMASVMRDGRALEEEGTLESLYKGILNRMGARDRHGEKIAEMNNEVIARAEKTETALERLQNQVALDFHANSLGTPDPCPDRPMGTYHAFKNLVRNCIDLVDSVDHFTPGAYEQFKDFLRDHYIYNPENRYDTSEEDDSYCFYEKGDYADEIAFHNTRFVGGHYMYHMRQFSSEHFETIYAVVNFCKDTARSSKIGREERWSSETDFQNSWSDFQNGRDGDEQGYDDTFGKLGRSDVEDPPEELTEELTDDRYGYDDDGYDDGGYRRDYDGFGDNSYSRSQYDDPDEDRFANVVERARRQDFRDNGGW